MSEEKKDKRKGRESSISSSHSKNMGHANNTNAALSIISEATKSDGNSTTDISEFPDIAIAIDERTHEMTEMKRTFSSVLYDFEGDKSAEKFVEEYKKLYDALKESHRQLKHYMIRCSNLQTDIKNNAEKVHLALHLSREDKEIISHLSQQVKQAWMEVEDMGEKEAKAKKAIASLQQEIQMLIMMVDSSLGIEELGKMAEKTAHEHAELDSAFTELREELEFKEIKLHETHERMKLKDELCSDELKLKNTALASLEEKNKEMLQKTDELDTSIKRLETIRMTVLQENAHLLSESELQNKKIVTFEQEIASLKGKLEDSIELYYKQRNDSQEKVKELQVLSKQIKKMKRITDIHHTLIENLSNQLKLVKTDVNVARKDLHQKQRQCDSLEKKLKLETVMKEVYKRDVAEKENNLKTDRAKMSHLRTEYATAKDQLDGLENRVQNLLRANNTASRIHLKLAKRNKEIESNLILQKASNAELTSEVKDLAWQVRSAVTCINALGVDKRKLFLRVSQAITMAHKLSDEIDTKENLLLTLDKLNQDLVGQLKNTRTNLVHMTNQCDSVKNDLHFSELKNEDLLLANTNFSKQSSSLADDLIIKEKKINDLNLKCELLKKTMNKQQTEMSEIIQQHNETKLKVKEMDSCLAHMEKLLCDKDARIQELNQDVEKLISQRNIVSLQCIKRMEEISFLTDKNSVLEDIMKMGNNQYNKRLQEIKQLEFQILDLNRQNKHLNGKLENVDNLKSKLGLANQQLVFVKARYRALEGEHPYNLHRWRHLEAKEFSHYEMIIKIQFLLKRLIAKTDEATRLEGVIIEKTFIVGEMQNLLRRRPSAETVKKANSQVVAKKKLERKLKVVLAERNLAEWRVDEQKKKEVTFKQKLNVQQKKSIQLEKSKQKLQNITSRFPGITDIAQNFPKGNECTIFGVQLHDDTNFLPNL